MKVRKLAVALALVGGLGSGVANALGLGEVELQSYLNEPLDAEIELRNTGGVGPDEIFVNLAPPQVFDRVGIDRDFFLTNLKFNVTTAPNGQLVVNVTTRQAVREPYLNFLIEVTWPSGKLLREYSMLLDPPVYADKVGDKVPVQAPSTASPSQTRQAPTRQAQASTPARASSAQQTSGYGDTFGPTGPSDTLWGIALAVRPDASYTPQQVMLALQDLNPDAFIGGNINRLKRGQVLRIPSAEQISKRTSGQALREVVAQNQSFKQPTQTVDATGQQPGSAAPAPAPAGDELRLVAGDSSATAKDGASSGGADGVAGGQEGSTEVVMEQLDKSKRENEELNSRVEDLEAQLATMQRLVELKNSQLAELQAKSGQAKEQASAGATAPESAEAAEQAADAPMANGDEAMASSDEAMSSDGAEETGGDTVAESGEAAMGSAADEGGETTSMAGADTSEPMTDEQAAAEPAEASDGEADMAAGNGADQPSAMDEEAAPAQPVASEKAKPAKVEPQKAAPETDKGFFGNLVEELKTNSLYQLLAGGAAIVVLLLLGLLARRNANREKAFYDQLNEEAAQDADTFDLGDDSGESSTEEKDVLAEADAYIAYGRHDQAAEVLESAISREPSRTDLRLKLLSVYADSEDRAAFEKQYGELEALEDEAALDEAHGLRVKLEEAESTPSIDDLESQLRSDSAGGSAASASDEDIFAGFDLESEAESEPEPTVESESAERTDEDSPEQESEELDFADLELDDEPVTETAGSDIDETREKSAESSIEYDLSDLGLDDDEVESASSDEETATGESTADDLDLDFNLEDDAEEETAESTESSELSEDDFGSLELDEALLDDSEDAPVTDSEDRATSDDELPSLEEEPELATDDAGNLDESFLDDLDAELEKVATETDELGASDESADNLDELELDVSDEDLALMEEVAETPSEQNDSGESDDQVPELDEELGLEDSLDLNDDEIPTAEETVEDVSDSEPADDAVDPEKVGEVDKASAAPSMDFDESSLEDEDDFDFLAGTDEAATKLDLARAYIEMGDADGARDILEEVSIEGSDEQKTEAQDLLKNLA